MIQHRRTSDWLLEVDSFSDTGACTRKGTRHSDDISLLTDHLEEVSCVT